MLSGDLRGMFDAIGQQNMQYANARPQGIMGAIMGQQIPAIPQSGWQRGPIIPQPATGQMQLGGAAGMSLSQRRQALFQALQSGTPLLEAISKYNTAPDPYSGFGRGSDR